VIKWWELFNFVAEQLVGKRDMFIGCESYFLFDIQFHPLLVKNSFKIIFNRISDNRNGN
jgi:hypothetical protein